MYLTNFDMEYLNFVTQEYIKTKLGNFTQYNYRI